MTLDTSLQHHLQDQLGPLAIPMAVLSLIVAIILIERLLVLFHASLRFQSFDFSSLGRTRRLPWVTAKGIHLLQGYAAQPKAIREEVSGIWLVKQKRTLSSGLRLLQVIAMLAPLLGLFGTVLGLIKVFDDLALITGAVEPSMLAEGLGLAMYTTAAGLLIAVPAIVGAQGFAIWVDKLIHHAEHVMNHYNLMQEGVPTDLACAEQTNKTNDQATLTEAEA